MGKRVVQMIQWFLVFNATNHFGAGTKRLDVSAEARA